MQGSLLYGAYSSIYPTGESSMRVDLKDANNSVPLHSQFWTTLRMLKWLPRLCNRCAASPVMDWTARWIHW
ncbi:hypothetical protein AVEN_247926-1 [Araneus ventricosus]|uniref:Uncharacterized protein n=1 Tax=Araneus ventricosus TaxID=182803 RepID=A0A4Y2CI76_ARAVE|nr:hypothetical protein AVEN_247926-1 [Araneus ventricosus]